MLAGKTAKRVIDATGLVVSPGFIDIHNHSDDTILVDGNAESMVRQGVTSMIFGEGGSAAPSRDQEWKDFNGYFANATEARRRDQHRHLCGVEPGLDLRARTQSRASHGGGIDEMRALVRQAMEQGALGVASSLSGPPGSWIDTDTLVAMCEEASKYGGIYSTHMRTEGQRRVRIGGGSDRNRAPGQGARRYHSSQDRRPQTLGTDAGAGRPAFATRASGARMCKPMSIPIAPGRTISPPSFRPGRTKAGVKP